MERKIVAPPHKHRRYFFGTFVGTALWVLPTMIVLMLGGFVLAERYVGPTFLQPNAVNIERPQPIRILSPSEAAAVARDEPSRVWSEGVNPTDIPKMTPDPTQKRPHGAWKKPAASAKDKTAPAPPTPAAEQNAVTPGDTPAPSLPEGATAAPDAGNGDNISPD